MHGSIRALRSGGEDQHDGPRGDRHPLPPVGLVARGLARTGDRAGAGPAAVAGLRPPGEPAISRRGAPLPAIDAARRFPHSHVARVIAAGLSTFQQKSARGLSAAEVIEATGRALERTRAQTTTELSRGVGSLATIATTSPFIGLFGTVIGIVHAFQRHRRQPAPAWHHHRLPGDRRGAADHRPRPGGGRPGGLDVQLPEPADPGAEPGDGEFLLGADRLLPGAGGERRGRRRLASAMTPAG